MKANLKSIKAALKHLYAAEAIVGRLEDKYPENDSLHDGSSYLDYAIDEFGEYQLDEAEQEKSGER